VSRYRFIVSEKAHHSVRLMCRALDVSPSGFYDWCKRSPSDRELTDRQLDVLIRRIFTESRGRYGSPRVHAELRHGHGIRVARKRVERLMRVAGLAARRRRRRSLTKPNPAAVPAPDLVGRDFTATAPGTKLVGDITYLPTVEGWLYLATVLDLATGKLIGYSMAEHMRAELTIDAINMAATHTELRRGCIFHTDQGSQYTSAAFRGALLALGVRGSMGRVGSCYDNAPAESWFATLKVELEHTVFASREEARRAVFTYINYYNHRRRHSTISYLTPQEAELRYRHGQPLVA
jgi:transposase InsO family protein